MADAKKTPHLLRRQPPMRRVLLALLPCVAGSIYFFGWRSLAVILVACAVGFLAEWLFCRRRGEPVSEAVFVTAVIFALIMPPTVPWHVVVIGVLFAIVFTKELFGGFGRNLFNPAMVGRCFVYICFPVVLTAVWAPAAPGPYGALAQWTTASTPDKITSATSMAEMKAAALAVRDAKPEDRAAAEQKLEAVRPSPLELLIGRMGGTMGVTSAFLILVGGLFLLWTRTASLRIVLSLVIAYAVLDQVLHMAGVRPVPDAARAVLGGGFLFGAFFMATDPVSAAKTKWGQVFYGVLIAVCVVVIRNFSIFNGGLMFSILLGNVFAPVIDLAVETRIKKKKTGVAKA